MPKAKTEKFFLFYWETTRDHLRRTLHLFANIWSKTYVVLIAKNNWPRSIFSFIHISLCNICLKMITKILLNQLKSDIHNFIGLE